MDDRGREIVVPPVTTSVTVTPDGVVSADGIRVARIRVVEFENDQELRKTRSGMYTTDAQPAPAADARVAQGMLEQSNIKAIVEMTRTMEILRSFQAPDNALQAAHKRHPDLIPRLPQPQPQTPTHPPTP